MTDYPQTLLAEKLRSFKSANKPTATWQVLATTIGLSAATLSTFLACNRTPHRNTTDVIVSFLMKKGLLDAEAVATPHIPERLHPVAVSLSDSDYIDVLSSIGSNAALSPERREKLIGSLFRSDFPNL